MPRLIKALSSLGDQHLGEGDAAPKLEDFPARVEVAYVAMIKTHLRIIGPDVEYEHVFLGDWFDLLAVRYEGQYGVVPTEEASLAKVEAVLRGHAKYISELRGLLVLHPNLSYRIIIGNHDLGFRWPGVQALIKRALAPEGAEHRVTFHEELPVGETVLYVHGDKYDAFSANPPVAEAFKEDVVIGRKVIGLVILLAFLFNGPVAGFIFYGVPYSIGGVAGGTILSFMTLIVALRIVVGRLTLKYGRKVTILNERMASYVHAKSGMWLKRMLFPDINRRADHSTIYVIGIARKPYAWFLLVPLLLLQALVLRCVHAIRHVRDSFRFGEYLSLLTNTLGPDQYVRDMCKFLGTRAPVRHLIVGHTHEDKIMTYDIDGRTVMYYNSGIGGLEVRTSMPQVRCRTSWIRVETFFRRVAYYWRHAPHWALLSTLAYGALPTALFLLPPWHVVEALRLPVALISGFLLLWWQYAAEYKDTMFFRLAPIETLFYDDGSVQVRGLHYDHAADRFLLLTGEDAVWDQS